MIPTEAQLLTIHVGGNRRHNGKYLYEAIVETARAMKLAGASVFPVEMSYGSHGQIHDELSDYSFVEIPVLIEIVEGPERVAAFLSALGAMISPAMVTIEPARVVRYSHTERPMIMEGSVQKVTIYIGSQDTWQGRNLATAIVERCRAQGLAGATMTRGNMGFGKNSLIHRAASAGFIRRHAGTNRSDRSARTDRGGLADSRRDGRGRVDCRAGRAGRSVPA